MSLMEKSELIHVINLGHYLENTPFAQDLLKHNMEMEPNMEWKIWTEKDPEIQEGIKSYTGPVSKNYLPYLAGAYLSHYILYHFGGVYCEMDYEFKIKDFFYNLYQKGDVVHNAPSTWYFLNCNCMQVHYFPYPKHDLLKRLLWLLNYNQEPLYLENIANDSECLSIKRALELKAFTQNEIDDLIKSALSKNIDNYKVLNHYQTQVAGSCKRIVFCSASTYLKLKKIEKLNLEFFDNEFVNLRIFEDVDISYKELPKRYDWGYLISTTKDIELFKAICQKYQIYKKDKVVILGQDIRKLINGK